MFCCKVMAIDEIASRKILVPELRAGVGCKIYDTRPRGRTFFCHWMLEKKLPDEWKPDRAKLVAVMNPGGHLTAFVVSSMPAAWRSRPITKQLKRWSLEARAQIRRAS